MLAQQQQQQQQQRRPAAIIGRPPARPAASRRPIPATIFRRDSALLVDGNPVGEADVTPLATLLWLMSTTTSCRSWGGMTRARNPSPTVPPSPPSRSTRKFAAPPIGFLRRVRAYIQPPVQRPISSRHSSLPAASSQLTALCSARSPPDPTWIIDGGCTKHVVPSLSDLTTITDGNQPFSTISVANKERLPIQVIVTVTICLVTSTGARMPVGCAVECTPRPRHRVPSLLVPMGL
eukprot:scaffold708_cov86-Isochrysis_galbana.AAC.4